MKQHTIIYCPDGRKHNKIEDIDAGEKLCTRCGIVFEEKTIFDETVSLTVTRNKKDTGFIGSTNKHIGESTYMTITDNAGKPINQKNKLMFKQINTLDLRIKIRANRSTLLREVRQCCDILNINETIENEIIKCMKNISDQKLTRGRILRQVIAATIYYICKKYELPKTMSEISKTINVPTKVIYRNLRFINDAYGSIQNSQPISYYVSRYFTKTDISPKYEKDILELLEKVEKVQFHIGKQPATVIGGLMKYFVTINTDCNYKGTFADIAKACSISEVSLRNTCNQLIPILGV
jgi:transcription initiation factor TFIIIB Brf1 subunit/transcription initiation factor TFIIB